MQKRYAKVSCKSVVQKRRATAMAAQMRTSQQRQARYLSVPRRKLNRENRLTYILKFVPSQLFFEGVSRSISGAKTFTVSFKNFGVKSCFWSKLVSRFPPEHPNILPSFTPSIQLKNPVLLCTPCALKVPST